MCSRISERKFIILFGQGGGGGGGETTYQTQWLPGMLSQNARQVVLCHFALSIDISSLFPCFLQILLTSILYYDRIFFSIIFYIFFIKCSITKNSNRGTTLSYFQSQSRQSAKRFLQRRNWNSPTTLGAGGCAPPPFGPGGRAHSLTAKGLGESQFRRGDIHVVLCTCKYFVLSILPFKESTEDRCRA
jgi:hypothetical protein